MKRNNFSILLISLFLINFSAVERTEGKAEVLFISPNGAFCIESEPAAPAKADRGATEELWVVSTKDPTQRAKLPKQSADSPTDDEFHFSPNEEWIFGLRHVGSGL